MIQAFGKYFRTLTSARKLGDLRKGQSRDMVRRSCTKMSRIFNVLFYGIGWTPGTSFLLPTIHGYPSLPRDRGIDRCHCARSPREFEVYPVRCQNAFLDILDPLYPRYQLSLHGMGHGQLTSLYPPMNKLRGSVLIATMVAECELFVTCSTNHDHNPERHARLWIRAQIGS